MKLLLVTYSLSQPGGAERVLSIMANFWSRMGWRITVLTLDREESFYPLADTVTLCGLDVAAPSKGFVNAAANTWKRVRGLRRAIKDAQPDAVIALMSVTNVLTLLATQGLNIPVIVSERNNPAQLRVGAVWNFLRNWTYPHSHKVVLQSEQIVGQFSSTIKKKVTVIPNPVPAPDIEFVPVERRHNTILAMGSLTQQKGFDLLLQAFALVATRHPQWRLQIWGEGSLRSELEALRDELGLQRQAAFCGRTRKPFEEMRHASLFVLSSRYEGFPNALCEAMACGLPAISFDCVSGPRDIVRHGVDGLLVPPEDVDALAEAMNRLIENEEERRQFSAKAPEVVERFSVDEVMSLWEALLDEVMA